MFCLQALIRDEFEKTKVTLTESSRRKLEAAVASARAESDDTAKAAAAAPEAVRGHAAVSGTGTTGSPVATSHTITCPSRPYSFSPSAASCEPSSCARWVMRSQSGSSDGLA